MANDKFDGQQFIGLDSEAIGDGTGGTTRVLDTWVENQLDNNARYLWGRPEACSFSPMRDVEGIRHRYASTQWGTIRWLPATLDPSMSSVSMVVSGLADGRGTATDVDFRLSVIGFGQSSALDLSSTATLPQGTDEQVEVSVDLTGKIKREQGAYVLLQMRSRLDANPDSLLAGLNDIEGPFASGTTSSGYRYYEVAIADTAPAPSPDMAIVVGVLEEETAIEDATNVYDPMYAEAVGGEYRVVVDKLGVLEPVNTFPVRSTAVGSAGLYAISYFEPRSYTLQFDYDEAEPGRNWTPKQASEMLANETVDGPDVSKHADNLDGSHGRERIQSFGLPGRQYPGQNGTSTEVWGLEPTAWHMVNGYPASAGWAPMARRQLKLDKNQSVLTVDLLAAPVVVKNFLGETEKKTKQDRERCEWEFRLTLERMVDGMTSWSQAEQVIQQTVNVATDGDSHVEAWPTNSSDLIPFLKQAYHNYYGQTNEDYSRTLREGILYLNNGDFNPLQPVSMSLDLSNIDDQLEYRNTPMRLRIEASLFDWPSSLNNIDFRLYLLDFAATETSKVAPL